jgi:hypothetical protein
VRLGGDPMSPSAEALELLHESRRIHRKRPLFTERRNRFWRRAWPWLVAAGALAVWLVARPA